MLRMAAVDMKTAAAVDLAAADGTNLQLLNRQQFAQQAAEHTGAAAFLLLRQFRPHRAQVGAVGVVDSRHAQK
jgi:phosphoglycerate dehydrogenase-like enzyme